MSHTFNDKYTFIPTIALLKALAQAEGIYEESMDGIRIGKNEVIEALLNGIQDDQIDSSLCKQELEEDSKTQNAGKLDEHLKMVFERYCLFGEPTNTKYLKSSKFLKMLREAGLIKS
jgi:hypothetical protein